MKKLKTIVSLLLAICFSFVAAAYEITPSPATVVGKGMFSDGTRNYKTFTVEASAAGEFHIGFWLSASILGDNGFTSFKVYANNKLVGAITPDHDGWQSIGMDENKKIRLNEGLNSITISTTAPEIPEVENIKISYDLNSVNFDRSAYEQYVRDAANGKITAKATTGYSGISVQAAGPASMTVFSNVNLNYTYYKKITLEKNDRLHIETESEAGHILDVVYIGKITFLEPITPTASYILPPDSLIETIDPKHEWGMSFASSEEIQRYNWTTKSDVDEYDYSVSTYNLVAPIAGVYMVLVRTDDNSKSDELTISISVNDKNTRQRKQPICSSTYGVIIPADGYDYACMTTSYDADADPMLFVHGGSTGGIIGFNDDAASAKRKEHNLGARDSYLSQTYQYPSKTVSVCNYNTETPVSKCTIIARMPVLNGSKSAPSIESSAAGIDEITITDNIIFPGHISLNSSFTINAGESTIESIGAYSLDGKCVGSVSVNSEEASLMASDLNITEKGLYVIRVRTTDGTAAKKLITR